MKSSPLNPFSNLFKVRKLLRILVVKKIGNTIVIVLASCLVRGTYDEAANRSFYQFSLQFRGIHKRAHCKAELVNNPRQITNSPLYFDYVVARSRSTNPIDDCKWPLCICNHRNRCFPLNVIEKPSLLQSIKGILLVSCSGKYPFISACEMAKRFWSNLHFGLFRLLTHKVFEFTLTSSEYLRTVGLGPQIVSIFLFRFFRRCWSLKCPRTIPRDRSQIGQEAQFGNQSCHDKHGDPIYPCTRCFKGDREQKKRSTEPLAIFTDWSFPDGKRNKKYATYKAQKTEQIVDVLRFCKEAIKYRFNERFESSHRILNQISADPSKITRDADRGFFS